MAVVFGVESISAWIIGESSGHGAVIAAERAAAVAAASSQRSDASNVVQKCPKHSPKRPRLAYSLFKASHNVLNTPGGRNVLLDAARATFYNPDKRND